jgi:hypothetical protein
VALKHCNVCACVHQRVHQHEVPGSWCSRWWPGVGSPWFRWWPGVGRPKF